MLKYFSHNTRVVNFWLTHCVFPLETKQFAQRLACNAWHLADNAHGMVAGFSGTNDNHRLLPLQVKQHVVEEPSLKATNGKMLAVILDNPTYSTLTMVHRTSIHVYPTCDWTTSLMLSVKLVYRTYGSCFLTSDPFNRASDLQNTSKYRVARLHVHTYVWSILASTDSLLQPTFRMHACTHACMMIECDVLEGPYFFSLYKKL